MSYSCVAIEVHSADGKVKEKAGFKFKNLTTDTASGYSNRRDGQAKAMGGGSWFGSAATLVGNATATTATSLTNSGASFPTSNQGLAGAMVAVGPNASGTGSTVMGVIVSNTSTALTVDQWTNVGTGVAGTTPNATASYQVLPGQMPAMYIGLTQDATAPSSADTSLASELTTNGFARALATYAHTAAATTYTLQKVFNATGTATINKEAEFGAANPTAGGWMPFESLVPNAPVLISGDSLTLTCTVTIS